LHVNGPLIGCFYRSSAENNCFESDSDNIIRYLMILL